MLPRPDVDPAPVIVALTALDGHVAISNEHCAERLRLRRAAPGPGPWWSTVSERMMQLTALAYPMLPYHQTVQGVRVPALRDFARSTYLRLVLIVPALNSITSDVGLVF